MTLPRAEPPRRDVATLQAFYRNESVHTDRVAVLALTLFDGIAAALRLPPEDRPLLAVAAHLHDVAFRTDPERHAEVAAEMIRRGVDGLNAADRDTVAAAVLLHGAELPRHLAGHALLAPGPDRARRLRLGALLRVADALDHGHLQDARIEGIDCSPGRLVLRVSSAWCPGQLERARQKADLWPAAFPRSATLRIEEVQGARPLFEPSERWPVVLRRLLWVPYRQLTDIVRRAGDRVPASEDVHQARVAARRLRLLLSVFADRLDGTPAERAGEALGDALGALGGARDLDVWLAWLQRPKVRALWGGHAGADAWLSRQQLRRDAAFARQAGCWQRPGWQRVRRHLGLLLRVDLPARLDEGEPIACVALRLLRRAWKKAAQPTRIVREGDSADLHQVRIALRRVRYLIEAMAPALPAPVVAAMKAVHGMETRLGRLHDLDVAIERLQRDRHPVAAQLAEQLVRLRVKRHRKVVKQWKEFRREMKAPLSGLPPA